MNDEKIERQLVEAAKVAPGLTCNGLVALMRVRRGRIDKRALAETGVVVPLQRAELLEDDGITLTGKARDLLERLAYVR